MPFSASTCITELGTTSLGPILSAYTDFDSYLNPFSFVNTNQITGAACPYVFTGIPDGATNIRLIDPTNSCCITIPIQSDNFCNTCDLGFTVLSSQTNSQIIAGDLTGSCQANISDYVVNWYGPNSATNIAFRSGKGNTFSYQFTHPLTGSGFVFAQSGIYTPIIDRVRISGITFSHTGGTGTYDATLDCFDAVQVNPLTCDNGNTPTSTYTHSYYFSGTGASSIPLNVTFQLSSNTNYFAYSFTGQTVPDNLRITYSGGTNPPQVVLEDITIGSSVPSASFSYSRARQNNSTQFKKVLCLTGLTRIPGDSLSIRITPASGNTEWALNLRCLSSFSCDTCQQNSLQNNIYSKIIKSSITVVTASCFTNIGYKISGCTDTGPNTDLAKYWPSGNPNQSISSFPAYVGSNSYSIDNNLGLIPRSGTTFSNNFYLGASTNLSRASNSCFNPGTYTLGGINNYNCFLNPPAGQITFSKYVSGTTPGVGVIDMTFTNPFHVNYYYTQYLSIMSQNVTWGISACSNTEQSGWYPGVSPLTPFAGPFSGGPSSNGLNSYFNSQDIRYYGFLVFCVPSATGSTVCKGNTIESGGVGFNGNLTLAQCYAVHPSSVVTTGVTGSNYSMRIVMNTMQKDLIFNPCEGVNNCNSLRDNIVNLVNISSTGTATNVNFTSTAPALFSNPWVGRAPLRYSTTIVGTTGISCSNLFRFSSEAYVSYADQENITVPQNPTTLSAITAYSAVTCPNFYRSGSPLNFTSGSTSVVTNNLYLHACYTELLNEFLLIPDPPPLTSSTRVYRSYEIYCLPITNGIPLGGGAGSVNPNVTNPNYVLAYRYRFPPLGTGQEVCNSTYIIGC